MQKLVFAGLILISLPLFAESSVSKFFAIVFGKSDYPSSLLNVSDDTRTRNISWMFYYIEADGKKILIDTGFTEEHYVKNFGIKEYESPLALLKKINVEPESITDIVITHSHFDHMGGVILFPKAKIHIQFKEFESFKTTQNYKANEKFFQLAEIKSNIKKYESPIYLTPDITVSVSAGHTIGSQYVLVKTENRNYLITGDECYLVKECEKGIGLPSKVAYSVNNNKSFIKLLRELKKKNSNLEILTLHDPEIASKYEARSPGVYQIYLK